jgi:heme O synthase-like polyprenyltransferase
MPGFVRTDPRHTAAIFLYYSASFAFHRSNVSARRLLAASIIYLPAVFVLISLNKK